MYATVHLHHIKRMALPLSYLQTQLKAEEKAVDSLDGFISLSSSTIDRLQQQLLEEKGVREVYLSEKEKKSSLIKELRKQIETMTCSTKKTHRILSHPVGGRCDPAFYTIFEEVSDELLKYRIICYKYRKGKSTTYDTMIPSHDIELPTIPQVASHSINIYNSWVNEIIDSDKPRRKNNDLYFHGGSCEWKVSLTKSGTELLKKYICVVNMTSDDVKLPGPILIGKALCEL
jgi:hypothetical protein